MANEFNDAVRVISEAASQLIT